MRYSHLIFLLLLSPSLSVAQIGGFAGTFSRIGFGPKLISMGNAYTAGTSQGIYGQYNPALSGYIEERVFDLSTGVLSFDRRLSWTGLSYPLPPSAGINFGLTYSGVTDFDGRTSSGYHTDSFSIYEIQFQTSFGIRITPKTNIGAGIKFSLASYHNLVKDASAIGFDIGFIHQFSNNFQFGFAAQDLISTYVWDTQQLYGTIGSNPQRDRFPARLKFGTQFLIPEARLTLTTDFEKRIHFSKFTTTTISTNLGRPLLSKESRNIKDSSNLLRAGVAWNAHERITIRTGWQIHDLNYFKESNSPSAGFTINLPFDKFTPTIDYAFVLEPNGVSSFHLFGFGLTF